MEMFDGDIRQLKEITQNQSAFLLRQCSIFFLAIKHYFLQQKQDQRKNSNTFLSRWVYIFYIKSLQLDCLKLRKQDVTFCFQ